MSAQLTLEDQIAELVAAYPIDPPESLLQAGLQMEYGISASKGQIRFAAAELAKAGEIDIAPRTGGSWRYSLTP